MTIPENRLMLPLARKSQTGEINLILASGSARRKLLLETAGFKFTCVTSNFPEDLDKSGFPDAVEYVRATCRGKLEALPQVADPKTIQIACDTVVIRPDDGAILEKPSSHQEAFEMIESLLGKRVKVVSVVHLRLAGRTECFHEESELVMRGKDEISGEDILGYLEDVNYSDLAGGLAVQSSGMIFVKNVLGCYHNVMGFPISSHIPDWPAPTTHNTTNMDAVQVFELIPEDEELVACADETGEYGDDPFASEKEDSLCGGEQGGGSVTVLVPMVRNEPLILPLPSTIGHLLEILRQDLPAAFDSKDEFIGRIYCAGELAEEPCGLVEEGAVVVLINDLLREAGSADITDSADSEESADSAETEGPSEPNELSDASVTRESSESSIPSVPSVPNRPAKSAGRPTHPKSLMTRFKNLWTSDKPAKTAIEPAKPATTVRLEFLNKNADSSLPHFIEDVLEYLEADTQIQEGLFRLSGTFSRIQTLQDRLNSDERLKAMSLPPSDCHNVASLLKQFLRNLPEPLLTFDLYDAWQSLGGWTESRKVSSQISRFLVNKLPAPNKSVLSGLMSFLHGRLKDSEITRMTACNFGTVIGPNLLWHRGEDRQSRSSATLGLSLQSTTLASQICTHFLLNYEEIFMNLKNDGDLGVLAYGRALYDYPEILLREDQIVFITGIEDRHDGWWRGYIKAADEAEDSSAKHSQKDEAFEQKFPSNYVHVEAQESDTQIIERITHINK